MADINVAPINILGGSFLGNLLTALCFGVLTIQISSYYHTFPNDGRPVKMVVAFLWVLEAFQLACCTQAVYWWSVTNYRNPLALQWSPWKFGIYQINIVCSSVTVQTFFAYRVYCLSSNLYVGLFVQALVLLQFGFGAATTVRANMNLEFQVIVKGITRLVVAWLTIQTASDIAITICMCLLLQRRRTGFQKTDSMINRMLMYTVSTGLITSVLSCFILVVFVKYGFHISELTIGMPLGGFYSVSMLANLHSRTTLQAKLAAPNPFELISTSIKNRIRQNTGDPRNEERVRATRINITTEVVRDDVDVQLTDNDAKVRFSAPQSPVLEEGGSEPEAKVSVWPR